MTLLLRHRYNNLYYFGLTNLNTIMKYNYFVLLKECIKPIEFQSNKSKTGSKIKIQSDNADLAINEVNFHMFIFLSNIYNLKYLH